MNPHKGEVALQAGERALTLKFSIDAICRLEERTGRVFGKIAVEMGDADKASVTLARDLLHTALFENHPEIGLIEAGELIPEAGGVTAVMVKISEAIVLAFPSQEASGTPRPQNRATRRRDGKPS